MPNKRFWIIFVFLRERHADRAKSMTIDRIYASPACDAAYRSQPQPYNFTPTVSEEADIQARALVGHRVTMSDCDLTAP